MQLISDLSILKLFTRTIFSLTLGERAIQVFYIFHGRINLNHSLGPISFGDVVLKSKSKEVNLSASPRQIYDKLRRLEVFFLLFNPLSANKFQVKVFPYNF